MIEISGGAYDTEGPNVGEPQDDPTFEGPERITTVETQRVTPRSNQGLTTGDDQSPLVGVPGVTFTVREAAKACAVHANTVRRRLKSGEFPNAFRDGAGAWRIPVVDLEAAGLKPNRFDTRETSGSVVVIPEPSAEEMQLLREAYDAVKILEDEADALRVQVAALSQRVTFAETIASERAERIDDLRVALRALEAVNPRPEDRYAPMQPQASAQAPGPDAQWAAGAEPPAKRSRWRRR